MLFLITYFCISASQSSELLPMHSNFSQLKTEVEQSFGGNRSSRLFPLQDSADFKFINSIFRHRLSFSVRVRPSFALRVGAVVQPLGLQLRNGQRFRQRRLPDVSSLTHFALEVFNDPEQNSVYIFRAFEAAKGYGEQRPVKKPDLRRKQ